jgi:hypothetical protein
MLKKFISLENLEYFWSKVKKIIIDKDQAMDERVKVFESSDHLHHILVE